MEEALCGHGWQSAQTALRAGGREPKAKKHLCRAGFRQQNAEVCALKKVLKPGERKDMAVYLMGSYSISTTRACRVVQLPKSMFYYRYVKDGGPVIEKLLELSEKHHWEGQVKLYERIRNDELIWNYKRVRRVYALLGLKQRKRTKRRLPNRERKALTLPVGRNVS